MKTDRNTAKTKPKKHSGASSGQGQLNQNQGDADKSVVSLGHITEKQVAVLMTYILGINALLLAPTSLITASGTGAWMSVITSTLLGGIGLSGWVLWSKATGSLAFVPAIRKTLGRVAGDLATAGILAIFVFATSMNVRLFAGGAELGLLPWFPIEVLLAITLGASAYAAWLGLESTARTAVFFFVPTLVSVAVLLLAATPSFDPRNLLPLFGLGPGTVVAEGLKMAGLWGTLPAFAVLKSYTRDQKALTGGAFKGLVWASIGLLLSVLLISVFFPYPAGTRFTHPVGMLARSAQLGLFLQRLEAVFLFSWFFASAVQVSFSLVCILLILSQLTDVTTYKPFLPSVVTLSFGVAALPKSLVQTTDLFTGYFFRTWGNVLLGLGWVLYLVSRAKAVASTGDYGNDKKDV